MKAAFRSGYGSPEVLSIREINIPTPSKKQILIRVLATTVNRTDCGVLWGKPFLFRFFTGLFKPSLSSTGTDFAGIIDSVGPAVSKFKVGDRVWGFNDNGIGSHAQYLLVSEDDPVTIIPGNISYEQAAASAEGAHYAINFIRKAKVTKGQHVLVYGATGAIGSAAVQLLKYYGTYVTAVGDTSNIELLKSLGADKVVDYKTEDFTKDDQKYHVVLDAVGKSSFQKCKPLLYEGGIYMSSELGQGSENIYLSFTSRWSSKRLVFPIPSNIKASLSLMNELLEKKKFQPVIDRTYPLQEIKEAFRYVDSGLKTGNVMLSFGENYEPDSTLK